MSIPQLYDVTLDAMRPVTQADVDLMLLRLDERERSRRALVAALRVVQASIANLMHRLQPVPMSELKREPKE